MKRLTAGGGRARTIFRYYHNVVDDRGGLKILPTNMETDLDREPVVVAVIPAYNEELTISKVLQHTRMYADKIIVCDDGSVDNTCKIARASGATVVKHKRNRGYGAALSTLFKEAKKLNPDVMVTLDADGQHDPAYIPKLIKPILDGCVDVVIGSRFLSEDHQNSLPAYRNVGIKLITKLTNSASHNGVTDSQSGYRAYSREALQTIHPTTAGMGASTEILIKARKTNLRVVEIPVVISYRGETSTHNPVAHWLKVVLSTGKFISTGNPWIFFGVPGVGALALALMFWTGLTIDYSAGNTLSTYIAFAAIAETVVGVVLTSSAMVLSKRLRVSRASSQERKSTYSS